MSANPRRESATPAFDDRVQLVVPCYNEAARLDVQAVADALAAIPELDLLFVDDGSTDGTAAVLERLAGEWPGRARVLRLAVNQGKGEAVRQGLRQAVDAGVRYVGFWDADLATPLPAVVDFLRELRGSSTTDWVIGSRVRLLGRRIERRAVRHYTGRVFATAASLVLGLPVYDTQCGAKLFRATPLFRRCLDEPFLSRWLFDVELIARFQTVAAPTPVDTLIVELPLREWRDVRGSKVTGGAFARAALDLLRIYRSYPRQPVAQASAPPATRPSW